MSDQYPQNPDPYSDPTQGMPQYGQPQYGQQGQYGQPQYGQPQYGQQGQYGQPQYGQQSYPTFQGAAKPITPEDERLWGALAHGAALVAMIASAGFLGFVGSVVVYVLFKDRGPFVRAHAANSINVQITMFIWLVGLTIATFTIGILTLGLALIAIVPMFVAAFIVAGVLHAIGTVKAYQGQWWNPPLTPRFVK